MRCGCTCRWSSTPNLFALETVMSSAPLFTLTILYAILHCQLYSSGTFSRQVFCNCPGCPGCCGAPGGMTRVSRNDSSNRLRLPSSASGAQEAADRSQPRLAAARSKERGASLPDRPRGPIHRQRGRARPADDETAAEDLRGLPIRERSRGLRRPAQRHRHRREAGLEHHRIPDQPLGSSHRSPTSVLEPTRQELVKPSFIPINILGSYGKSTWMPQGSGVGAVRRQRARRGASSEGYRNKSDCVANGQRIGLHPFTMATGCWLTSPQDPGAGETAVLWNGSGLVVKRVEILPHTEPPRLRLVSANPAYAPYTRLADEAHIVGTVLWVLGKV